MKKSIVLRCFQPSTSLTFFSGISRRRLCRSLPWWARRTITSSSRRKTKKTKGRPWYLKSTWSWWRNAGWLTQHQQWIVLYELLWSRTQSVILLAFFKMLEKNWKIFKSCDNNQEVKKNQVKKSKKLPCEKI